MFTPVAVCADQQSLPRAGSLVSRVAIRRVHASLARKRMVAVRQSRGTEQMGTGFSNKVVLVTGGSRGLGAAMSRGFAAEGASVVVSSRKLESCEALVAEIEQAGGVAMPFAANTGKTEDL